MSRLKALKILLIVLLVVMFMNISIAVKGTGINDDSPISVVSLEKQDLRETVRGSIEDESWLRAKSREEVHTILGKYFEGLLLDDLTQESWEFIAEPTDWYSRAKLLDLVVLSDDGKRSVSEALISIEDLDTGHNGFGKGLFCLVKTDRGWRINYVAFSWGNS